MAINLTVAPNSNFETISFSLNFTCQEVPSWNYVHHVDVLVSKWSDLRFGVNDGSEFFVQQNVRTGFSVNLSNFAQYDDIVSLELIPNQIGITVSMKISTVMAYLMSN